MRLFSIFPVALFLLGGCGGIPKGIAPIEGFELEKYLGKWYEIARLDHSFERDLIYVTAEYSLREDGGVRVINQGYDARRDKWKKAEGRAYLVSAPNIGRLKVSFFGPFYGGYNILELDKEHYSYALVCGSSRSYLWILSRTPQLNAEIIERLIQKARELGFDVDKLILVQQR